MDWNEENGRLVREFRFGTYEEGVRFVVAVAGLASARDHHPDVLLGYRRVRVELTTHDAGGITDQDREMAAAISALPVPSPDA